MSYAIVTYAHGNTHYIIITRKVLWSEINIASQLTVRMFISTHAIIPLQRAIRVLVKSKFTFSVL